MNTDAAGRPSKWLELFILVVLVALIAALFPLTTIEFRPDSMTYLREAYRFAEDLSYGRDYRGPGMAAVNAAAMKIGGSSLAVVVMPRVAFAIVILLFYGFARRLYGILPAVAGAAALAIAPLVHHVSSHFHVDIFIIAWAMAALWSLYEALARRSWPLSVLSGVLFAGAFLTKESAILLLPLWVAGWIAFPPYDRRLAGAVAAELVALLAVVMPWATLVALDVEPQHLLGRNVNRPQGTFSLFVRGFLDQPIGFVASLPAMVQEFYAENILRLRRPEQSAAPFGWLLIVAQAVLLLRAAVWRKRGDIFVLLAFLCLSPLLLYLGASGYDSRQAAVILVVGFLSVPSLFALLIPEAASGTAHVIVRAGAVVIVATAVAALAVLTPYVRKTFTDGPQSYAVLAQGEYLLAPAGLLPPVWVEAADWLAPRVDANANVLTIYNRSKKALDVLLPSEPIVVPTGRINLKLWLEERFGGRGSGNTEPNAQVGSVRLLMLRHHRHEPEQWMPCIQQDALDSVEPRFCRFHYMDERVLLNTIDDHKVRFVVVGPQRAFFAAYFDRHPGFTKVHEATAAVPYGGGAEDTVAIYEVVDPAPATDIVLFVTATMPQMLQLFERTWPKAYEAWRREVLMGELGLSPEGYRAIFDGEAHCFDFADGNARGYLTECSHARTVDSTAPE